MGSPYLLAHGLGKPVEDASTTISIEEAGTYHVWVRTKDWAATFERKGSPGRFQVAIGGEALDTEFGNESPEWAWQNGGSVDLKPGEVETGAERSDWFLWTLRCHRSHDQSRISLPITATPLYLTGAAPCWA